MSRRFGKPSKPGRAGPRAAGGQAGPASLAGPFAPHPPDREFLLTKYLLLGTKIT